MWLSALSSEQRESLFGLAHNVVVSDGLLDPAEEGMLDEFRREMELHPTVQAEYLELDGVEATFDTRRSRIIVLLNLLRLSYADGAFEVEEKCVLKELSGVFAITDEEFRLLDNWVRRFLNLEKEARLLMHAQSA